MEFPGSSIISRKNNVKFAVFLVSGLKISEFCGVSRVETLFCLEFPGVK